MKIRIASLKGVLYEGEALEVNAKTMSGEITVLPHHRPIVTVLTKGDILVIDKEGKKNVFPVDSGFLEMNDKNELTLLVS